jgi:hypothetical protein
LGVDGPAGTVNPPLTAAVAAVGLQSGAGPRALETETEFDVDVDGDDETADKEKECVALELPGLGEGSSSLCEALGDKDRTVEDD